MTAVIVAGGNGSRLGADIKKQYIKINNKEILIHTLEVFVNCDVVSEIILVVPADDVEFVRNMVEGYGYSDINVVAGGTERCHSVYAGVKLAKTRCVIVHDAVRPFVTCEMIKNVYDELQTTNAVTTAVPVTDTIKVVKDDIVYRTIDRKSVYAIQTPQGFVTDILKLAYEESTDYSITDDCMLMENIGEVVKVIEGSYNNIKITTNIDLKLATLIMNEAKENVIEEKIEVVAKNGKKKVDIYTDGACSGNPGAGGYGVVMIFDGIEKELKDGFVKTTNNRMELLAVIVALNSLKSRCDVTLYSDSKYVVDAVNKGWLVNWEKKNWKHSNPDGVPNKDLWKQLLDVLNKQDVTFVWVKGHNDNKYNERCDELARSAITDGNLKVDTGYNK